jgi:hypothetical protein
MRNVYAVQLQLRAEPSRDVAWPSLVGAIGGWARSWYARRGTEIAVPAGQELRPIDGHSLLTTIAEGASGEKLWTMSWSYPADDDPSLLWGANATAAARGDELETSLVLRVGSRTYRVAPPSFRLRRPNVVKTLLEQFDCSVGGRQVTTTAATVVAADVAGLVEDLRSPDRRLPVVLISREKYSDRPLLDPGMLADQLAGLAHVRVFTDKWASFRLTSLLGKQHSCFNGAVRLYWPVAKGGDEVRADRPFMPEEVRAEATLVSERLLRRLAAASAFRFVEMDVTKAVRASIEKAALAAQARARDKALADATGRSELEALVNGLMDDKAKALEDARKARYEADMLRLELADQNERIADLEADLKDVRRSIGVTIPVAPAVPAGVPDEDVEPATVVEALDEAARRFAARVTVLDTARRSAEESDFGRPTEVFHAIMAIRDVADLYFASREADRPMGRWDDAFEERGVKYAAQESRATMNQFGAEREFMNDGVKRRIEKHLTVGGGDKKNCLQIYFDADDPAGRFVVAYCGRHLRTDRYR